MCFLAQGIQPALGIGYRIAEFCQLSIPQFIGSTRCRAGRIVQDILCHCALSSSIGQPLHRGIRAVNLLRVLFHLSSAECGLHAQLNPGKLSVHQIQLLIIELVKACRLRQTVAVITKRFRCICRRFGCIVCLCCRLFVGCRHFSDRLGMVFRRLRAFFMRGFRGFACFSGSIVQPLIGGFGFFRTARSCIAQTGKLLLRQQCRVAAGFELVLKLGKFLLAFKFAHHSLKGCLYQLGIFLTGGRRFCRGCLKISECLPRVAADTRHHGLAVHADFGEGVGNLVRRLPCRISDFLDFFSRQSGLFAYLFQFGQKSIG